MADDDVTITVSRADLDAVTRYTTGGYGRYMDAMARIRAAIPEPEWEPTEEQIVAGRKWFGLSTPSQEEVIRFVRELHDVGLIQ